MEEELDTSPSRGVAGVTVTRDRHGLVVTHAPKSLRLRPGDRLLSARVFFDGTPPEALPRVLEGAGGCRVSLRVRRPVTADTGDKGQRGTGTGMLPKLLPSRGVTEPAPSVTEPAPSAPKSAPQRLTVKEAAAGKTAAPAPPPESPKAPERPGAERKPKAPEPAFGAARVPSIAIAAPSAAVELAPEFGAAKAEAPGPAEPRGFAEGLRKLSLELEPPALEIAPPVPPALGKAKPAKFTLPRVGLAIAKFKPGGAEPLEPVLAPSGKLKIPKLTLVPFGDGDATTKPKRSGGAFAKPEWGAAVKLPKFGGSSPDIRSGAVGKTLRRAGSAESLVLAAVARKGPEGPGAAKAKGAPKFAMGFAGKRRERPLNGKAPKPLKVPALELAPPGVEEKEGAQRFGVKLPKFGGGSAGAGKAKEKGGGERGAEAVGCGNGEAQGKMWRWVPKVGFAPSEAQKARPKAGFSPPASPKARPKAGGAPPKPRFPDVELCPEATATMAVTPKSHFGGTGVPKFQLPKLELSPQPCEW